jgi:hypothetical protein
MQRTMIWAMLNIRENHFDDHFVINSCKFPTDNFFFPFQQVENRISSAREQGEAIAIKDRIVDINSISTQNTSELPLLSEALSRLYVSYKISGDNAGANKTFFLQKRLDLIYMKATLNRHFSTATFFGYYSNRFIRWYSDYGTNIVKCVIRTIELIILFGLIYFIDTYTSKCRIPVHYLRIGIQFCIISSRLRAYIARVMRRVWLREKHYRTSTELILHRRWMIIYSFSYYLFYNICHALLLSLNAFLTLGYGELTASSRLRFIYVIEGVLGWLLITFLTACILAETLQ